MTQYTPGMRVIIRQEEWMVRKTEKNTLGNDALYCVGISPLVKDREQVFLSDLEEDNIEIVDPRNVTLVADKSPHFRQSQLYIESQWRQQVPTDDKLHIGYKACMDALPFQLEPAQMALKKPRQRILIADEVGLGKTLEAGILMSELIARGKGRRILVVTVKSMMNQFQKEMWNRFSIPLVRLDTDKIDKIRRELPAEYNPFFYYDKTIVSVDTLKNDINYRTHLENSYWDIIVIDEAQNVAKRGSRRAQRAKLATLLAKKSDTMIMLSATPHDGHAESFASLMKMLDPTAIADEQNYTKDDIKGLFIRRFKKDVRDQIHGDFPDRRVTLEKCEASPLEEHAYDLFAEMKLEMDKSVRKGSGQLFKTGLQKTLFSSPMAGVVTIRNRVNKLKKKYSKVDMPDIGVLEEFGRALEAIGPKEFSRYQKLLEILNSDEYGWNRTATDDRLVIFTERIETMKFLTENLRLDLGMSKDQVQELSGQMRDVEIQKCVEDFGREESPIRVLVASDVASEGLNLHYLSHRLIHFDIPWSLMVFQQRNGRIDRYGQTQRPDIRYLVETCENEDIKGDLRNLEILAQKEEQAQENIGDPSLLMGQFSIEGEELIVKQIMENNTSAEDFSNMLEMDSEKNSGSSVLDSLLNMANQTEKTSYQINQDKVEDETLFSDKDYLKDALDYLNRDQRQAVSELTSISGLDVELTDNLRRRLNAQIPVEAMPQGNILRLSDDIEYVTKNIKESMKNDLNDSAWPQVQYLWKLHPIFSWVNDKASLFFKRGEVPVLGIKQGLRKGEAIYLVNGKYLNRHSEARIDDWFGVRVTVGQDSNLEILSMDEVISRTGINHDNLVNSNSLTGSSLKFLEKYLPAVYDASSQHLAEDRKEYVEKTKPQLNEEIQSLEELEHKHIAIQEELFQDNQRKQESGKRQVEELFKNFNDWVKNTMEIEQQPYIRFIAVLMGI
ncbi:ATP-dependent helicase [Lactobacillus delbrueckii subsp. bulgaricus]|nr:ATP-dependent helicase [Lactobacillus delbrueckii subsp. bulgaricus]MBT9004453.1 ATP-dependent helicase [Lactobacillus delbrueckii subsp. bulgaricus]MBT9005959.1 ATP-dependent helicase [Lactobacillus delbrueckii subsp. bulgaricus]MBT9007699.1 ATP-dependent helicase [Lactobacillus delbrueckii subsp. bulgaricus]MBT9014165.1 ATP-dependent helicase [Lactobacillus delbrueckii subsp. bulgaricus]